MVAIETVGSDELRAAAQSLFREYADFLRASGSCGYFDPGHFDHAKFAEEIESLPKPYADQGGEVLLASVDGAAAACIAFRSTPHAGQGACEIKRLYVRPAFRSQGLARKLIAEALELVIKRGFTLATLDTNVDNMPGAIELYQSFGFRIVAPPRGSIAFLQRYLP